MFNYIKYDIPIKQVGARAQVFHACLCILFICSQLPLAAKDTRELDSLAAKYMPLIQKEEKDTSRIWIRFGNSITWIAPDSARRALQHALDLSYIAKDDRGISICLMALVNF